MYCTVRACRIRLQHFNKQSTMYCIMYKDSIKTESKKFLGSFAQISTLINLDFCDYVWPSLFTFSLHLASWAFILPDCHAVSCTGALYAAVPSLTSHLSTYFSSYRHSANSSPSACGTIIESLLTSQLTQNSSLRAKLSKHP